jgi:hypothetical protein
VGQLKMISMPRSGDIFTKIFVDNNFSSLRGGGGGILFWIGKVKMISLPRSGEILTKFILTTNFQKVGGIPKISFLGCLEVPLKFKWGVSGWSN